MKSSIQCYVRQLFWCERLEANSLRVNESYERWLFVNHDGGIEVLLPTALLKNIAPEGQGALITFCFNSDECKVIEADPVTDLYRKENFISI
jgi:hypothetical protein